VVRRSKASREADRGEGALGVEPSSLAGQRPDKESGDGATRRPWTVRTVEEVRGWRRLDAQLSVAGSNPWNHQENSVRETKKNKESPLLNARKPPVKRLLVSLSPPVNRWRGFARSETLERPVCPGHSAKIGRESSAFLRVSKVRQENLARVEALENWLELEVETSILAADRGIPKISEAARAVGREETAPPTANVAARTHPPVAAR
jgi:hypothetical protein